MVVFFAISGLPFSMERRVAKKDIVRFHAAVQRLTAVAVSATPDYS
jgi:hypothetical protein